jgi:ABC-type transport system involved in multi-copper enzyme maturation permease subunit
VNPILIIAGASVKEHSRRKLILFFVGFSLLVMALLFYFVIDQKGQQVFFSGQGIVVTVADAVLSFFALLAALAVSMGNVGQPFASGEALSVIARPVTRWQYALGRLLGSIAVIAGLCLLLAVELQIVQIVAEETEAAAELWGHWAVTAFNLTILASIATLLSVAISTPIIVAIIAYFVQQAVGGITFARIILNQVPQNADVGAIKTIVEVLWYITPKFLTSPLQASRLPEEMSRELFQNPPWLIAWALAWLVGIVALTLFFVRRKEV